MTPYPSQHRHPHLAPCSSSLRLQDSEMGGAGWASPEGKSLNTKGGWALSHSSVLTAPPHLGPAISCTTRPDSGHPPFTQEEPRPTEGQCTESVIQNCTSDLLGSRPPSLVGQDKTEDPGRGLQELTRKQGSTPPERCEALCETG